MKYVWTPLLLIFAIVEYITHSPLCGSSYITGEMWFMWIIMAAMMSSVYYKGLSR